MKTRQSLAALALTATFVAHAGDAHSEEANGPPAPVFRIDETAWRVRYEAARSRLVDGHYRWAEAEFDKLAKIAPNEADRALALEMAKLADDWGDREEALRAATVTHPTPRRTRDEISILYASAFLYGLGTGAWFLLQTQPDTALTATLPFAGITALPVITLAIVDGHHPLPLGLPHGITAGLYLGLGESIWIVGYQHARADRLDASGGAAARWTGDEVASWMWGGATLGAITGGALATGLVTTPGRISFTASTTTWSGVIGGLTAAAILPDNDRRTESALLAAGASYNVGLLGGAIFASAVSPTVTRVRFADLGGVGGGLVVGGLYLSLAHRDADPRIGLGVTAAGAATGLAMGWILTSKMPREEPQPSAPTAAIRAQPLVMPVLGGGVVGVTGTL